MAFSICSKCWHLAGVLLLYSAGTVIATEGESQTAQSCADLAHNTNYQGHDITGAGLPTESVQSCCDLCNSARYPDCLYFTFNPEVACGSKQKGCCHLKTSKAGAHHSPVAISGTSTTHHPQPPPPPPPPPPPGAKNVLLMIADDLRPQLNAAYGHTWMQTPNIDAFTHTALTFTRAFVQQQVCSPSRNSFMTGRRPDKTRVWNFNDDFRVARPSLTPSDTGPGAGANWTTLPGYFKAHGYQVYGSGKLFHPNRPQNNDMPRSFDDYSDSTGVNRSCNGGKVVYEPTQNASLGQGSAWRRIIACEENDSEAQLTFAAIEFLKRATNGSNTRPFFIGMGHHRPHLPWHSPSRFIDQYGEASGIAIAKQQQYPATAASNQWHPWFDQVELTDVEPTLKQRYLRRGYYGAVSYYDYHFGMMLDALEASGAANSTVVLLTGDHGWHLGERNMWEKKGLDELDCRVPLLIRAPGPLGAKAAGKRTSALAQHVDIMPTLIDLAGLPIDVGEETPLSGVSLKPVLQDPPATGIGNGPNKYAYSQFPRCSCTYATPTLDARNGTCNQTYANAWTHESGATGAANHHVCLFTPSRSFDWMGYSVRSDQWRYTVFVEWDGDTLSPRWSRVQAEELYAHVELTPRSDDDFDGTYSEPLNRAVHPDAEAQAAIAKLRPVLQQHFSPDSP